MTTTVLIAEAFTALLVLAVFFFFATSRLRRLRTKVLLVVWASFGAVIAGVAVAVAGMAIDSKDLALLLAILTFVCLVGALCSLAVVRAAVRSMEEISNASALIAAGDLSVRVTPGSHDEAGELTSAFNSMTEAIETAFRECDRAAEAYRTLIASIGHDLRTPLASLQAMVEAVEDGIVEQPEVEGCYLVQMSRQIDDLAAMIDDLAAMIEDLFARSRRSRSATPT